MKENFAIKLRELRKASGMTQEQLAAEFGVSVQAVSKWETAASYPDDAANCGSFRRFAG